MSKNNQLIKYEKNPIKRIFSSILNRIKNRFSSSRNWNSEIEDMIQTENPDIQEQNQVKEIIKDLLSRNQYLFDTLDIRMLKSDKLEIFEQPLLERIVADADMQKDILELSEEELKTFRFILQYKTTDQKERIININTSFLRNISLNELQNLSESDRTKAISILLSNSEFHLESLSNLNDYYEKRRNVCKQIIDSPELIEKYDYDTYWEKVDNGEEIDIPYGLIEEMQQLKVEERIRWTIIETKYGMSLEKAKELCRTFGKDIDKIEQTEETRIIKELKQILEEKDIEKLKYIDLSENYANYEGTMNIVPNLRNGYLREYQKTLYQVKDDDYIGTQDGIKIYNALGINNDNADFNMILTAIGGIYAYSHDFSDMKKDWDRADSNHTISCSFIGNDFLGVTDTTFLLGFSDIKDNEVIHSRNQDAGAGDSVFEPYAKSEFLIPENQINTSKGYNEIVLERKIEDGGKLVNRKPTYAVFLAENLNEINDEDNSRWQNAKKMAKGLNIPIVVVDVQKCLELEWQKTQDMITLIKEQKRMDLIPEVIHKMENNRGYVGLSDINRNVFSDKKIKDSLEQIIGTIITSDTDTFNKGIEEFVSVTKEIVRNYDEHSSSEDKIDHNKEFKTYDYRKYLERLKVLFGSRNGIFKSNEKESNVVKTRDKNIEEQSI